MEQPRREMADWQSAPNEQQIKAVASATRLRIIRLCNDKEWTNQELAERLELDPSTVHRHIRILLEAGFLEPTDVRQGPSGAFEKPYRSTGLSWKLSFDVIEDEATGEVASIAAFRQELMESGNNSVAELTRFHLHLDQGQLSEFITDFKALVTRYAEDPAPSGETHNFGGLFVLHRLVESNSE